MEQEQLTQRHPISSSDAPFNNVIGSNLTPYEYPNQSVDVLYSPVNANSLDISQAFLQGCGINSTIKSPWRIPRNVENYPIGNNRLLVGPQKAFETSNTPAAHAFTHETHTDETSADYSSIAKFNSASSPEPNRLVDELVVFSETHPFEEMNRKTESIQVERQRSVVEPIYFSTKYRSETSQQLSDSRRSFAAGILGENHTTNPLLPVQTRPVSQIPAPSKYFYSTPSYTLLKENSSFKNVQNLPTSSGLTSSNEEVLIFVWGCSWRLLQSVLASRIVTFFVHFAYLFLLLAICCPTLRVFMVYFSNVWFSAAFVSNIRCW